MKKSLVLGCVAALLALSACKKDHPAREDLSYKCECGELTFKGQSYPLVSTESVSATDSTFDRAYYITAPIGNEDDPFAHHLNINFSLDNVLLENFFPTGDSNFVAINVEEVNRMNEIAEVTQYNASLGVVTVNPALVVGAEESISFNLQVTSEADSLPEPALISLVGNMTVER